MYSVSHLQQPTGVELLKTMPWVSRNMMCTKFGGNSMFPSLQASYKRTLIHI